jgi:hypothetical protein
MGADLILAKHCPLVLVDILYGVLEGIDGAVHPFRQIIEFRCNEGGLAGANHNPYGE